MKRFSVVFFRLLSLFGAFFTLAQLILKTMHSSICTTQGCLIVAKSVRFSDSFIILAGFITFSLLFLLSFSNKSKSSRFIDFILTLSLSAEGIFVGYQLFRIKHLCLFCLSVFAIFVLLSIARILQREYGVLTGFTSFAVILSLCYILKPPEVNIIASKPLVLVYKPTCSHCEKVIEEAKKNHVSIYTVKAGSCMDLLRMLNIKEVPVLIVNRRGKKEIIVGEKNIIQYLFAYRNGSQSPQITPITNGMSGFCPIGGGSCK